ncbi:scavenger receptor cysteine-rich type 1 protein M130-like [Aulostomus maculatus]
MEGEVLLVFLALWGSAKSEDVRLVGGADKCAGTLEVNEEGEWRAVETDFTQNLTAADRVCRLLDCGSAVSIERVTASRNTWDTMFNLFSLTLHLEITCSDSVRLVGGSGRCSGRLEVKSNQSWLSVCERDFGWQEAKVVCRELDCGVPSVFVLGSGGHSAWSKNFRCGGEESSLLDCETSDTDCSGGSAAEVTCSDQQHFRLTEGAGKCDGKLEMKYQDEWKPVAHRMWNLQLTSVVCANLDCGSALSSRKTEYTIKSSLWVVSPACIASPQSCEMDYQYSLSAVELTCSEAVRLVGGSNLCSGALEVKSNQLWSPVCEEGFDVKDAEVLCRELGCGPPSVLKGGLFGTVESPSWAQAFQCEGHESSLLDCGRSGSGNTCSPGKPVGLVCSDADDVRLVGGANRCDGRLEVKHLGEWRVVTTERVWTVRETAGMCSRLDCGSLVSSRKGGESPKEPSWFIEPACLQPGLTVMECAMSLDRHDVSLELTCSESARLVGGTSLCSGRVEVYSKWSWSSVCADHFSLQGAEVVCRELGCGAPSLLRGAPLTDLENPGTAGSIICDGYELVLLDCGWSDPVENNCVSGKSVSLTCSEAAVFRVVGEPSRCAGTLGLQHQKEWRPVAIWDSVWQDKFADAVCRRMNCGSAVSKNVEYSENRPVWWMSSSCMESASPLQECVLPHDTPFDSSLVVTCSDFLAQPIISFSASTDGVSEVRQQVTLLLRGSNFTISCSIGPQYPGGMFSLFFSTSSTARNYTLPAVNHSAHFLFQEADYTRRGSYKCVYHLSHVLHSNFSSESQELHLIIAAPLEEFIIRLFVHLLVLTSCFTFFYFYYKGKRDELLEHKKSGGLRARRATPDDWVEKGAGTHQGEVL